MDVEDGDQCHMIATIGRRQSPALGAEVCVNGSWISMEVDTRAAVSIISECTYRRYLHSVKQSHVSLRTYSAEPLVVLGEVYVQVLYKGELLALRLIVVSGDGASFVGRECLSEMEIDWKTLCKQSHIGIH